MSGYLSLVYFVLLAAAGAWVPYLALHLDGRGLSGAQVGWILGAMGGVRILGGPFWAMIADRWRWGAGLLALSAAGCAVFSALAMAELPYGALLVALVAASFVRSPASSLLDAEVVRGLEAQGRDARSYGRIRLWGSLGYLATSFVAGWYADRWSSAVLWSGIGLYALTAALALRLPSASRAAPRTRIALQPALRAMLADPLVLALLLSSIPYGMALNAYDSLYALHVRSLGLQATWTGAAMALGIAAEVAVMSAARPLLARYDAAQLAIAAGVIGALRYAATAMVADPWLLTATQALHGVGFGVWWVAAVEVLRQRTPDSIRSSALSIFVTAGYGVGPLLCGALAAQLLDHGGTVALFSASAALSLLASAVLALGVRWVAPPRAARPVPAA